MSPIKPFMGKHNWEGINYLSQKDDWKKNEKNDITIALNVSCTKKEKNVSCLCFTT